MPRTPRQERDLERARRASAAAHAQGLPAMDAALAQIDVAFGEAARVNAFKLRVERWLKLGPAHPEVRARFCAHAERLAGGDLDMTMALIERSWRSERKAFQIASALGRGSALSQNVLHELRLILRLLRFKHMQAQFPAIVAALRDEPLSLAAE